tara:strand:+ start:937 stop:1407 length:471 start_codon:yes stop_codon:yes gene_type:complete
MSFSKASRGLETKSSNHVGVTYKCDSPADEIKKTNTDCMNPAHNCRGAYSGTKFSDFEKMPTDSLFKRGKKAALKKAIQGCKIALNNNTIASMGNKFNSLRDTRQKVTGDLSKKFSSFGGKSRRKRRKRRKSKKKRRRKSKKKSRRKRKKSRRRKR